MLGRNVLLELAEAGLRFVGDPERSLLVRLSKRAKLKSKSRWKRCGVSCLRHNTPAMLLIECCLVVPGCLHLWVSLPMPYPKIPSYPHMKVTQGDLGDVDSAVDQARN
jgi:hypothetical protein